MNPKAFWYPQPGLSAAPLKASLALVLRDYPLLSGRMEGGGGRLVAMRKHLAIRISLCNAGILTSEVAGLANRSSNRGIACQYLVNTTRLSPNYMGVEFTN